jgi:hypothetical protein
MDTMSKRALRVEAEAFHEQRPDEQEKEAEQEKGTEREQGISSAIKEIEEQRRQERIAQHRRESEARAGELSHERHELEERIEAEAIQLRRSLNELKSLHTRHSAALREAKRPLDHGYQLQEVISARFGQWFGGFNNLTGVSAPFPGKDVPLPERDSLASPGSNPDKEAG